MQKEIERLRQKHRKGRLDLFSNVTWTESSRDLLEGKPI
jgi:hypothetical protein